MAGDLHSNTLVVGWREWASLPSIGIPWIKVKIDTGARSSALHAFDLEELAGDRVRFTVHPWQDADTEGSVVEVPIHDRRVVRSSSGHTEECCSRSSSAAAPSSPRPR